MEVLVQSVRKSFASNVTRDLTWRKTQLKNIARMIDENETELNTAILKDLNKHAMETSVFEFGLIRNAITHSLNNLDKWAKPTPVVAPITVRALYSMNIQKQPYGTALIIGAWNYPYQLLLVPLVGAIAAGNTAVCKPSELSIHTSELLEKLFPKYLDTECIKLVNGGIPETTALLKQKFDYIFYTGNTVVGKIIMEAAAKHMTPVTLECGGKSPVYIDASANLEVTANRLLWGRLTNAGQTCVAPDYVLCTKETQEKLLPHLKRTLVKFYGEDPQNSDSYGRLINQRHHKRVSALIDDSKVVIGGKTDEANLYISPTVMFDCVSSDKIMQEEIFGPVLPFKTVSSRQEAIDYVNEGSKPLALYVFSGNKKDYEAFRQYTSSGSMAYNEVIMQIGFECMPFGGVGDSGMGSYHGKYSFDAFSHERAVLTAPTFGESLLAMRYPPYNPFNKRLLELTAGELNDYGIFKFIFSPAVILSLAVGLGYLLKGYMQ